MRLVALIGMLFFAANANAQDPEWVVCGTCDSQFDYRVFLEGQVEHRPDGTYEFMVANHNQVELIEASVYIEHQGTAPPMILVATDPAPVTLQSEFEEIVEYATEDSYIVIPPDACTHCGSASDAGFGGAMEPDFLQYVMNHNLVDSVLENLRSFTSVVVAVSKTLIFGKHHTVVVIFPNGDTLQLDVKGLGPTAVGTLFYADGTATDSDGNPLDGSVAGSQYGGSGAGGGFLVRVGGGTSVLLCTSSNIPGSGVQCSPL
ncbi:hypothetical protein [Wenzhouxiangella sp. EGI_FJ10409]|uniref:hypothetical protein n=1 Tax=Wenzhouxiangella sp. EGI_FJ10409 TaxID=3243767 RepID=UPI0035DBC9FE